MKSWAKFRAGCAVALATTTCLAGAGTAAAVSIDFNNFSSTAGLDLNGSAARVGKVLRLVPASDGEVGTGLTKKAAIDSRRSFKTNFTILMHDGSLPYPGDGMAFVLTGRHADDLGYTGGGLGYAGIDPSIAVEFDIFDNPEGNDPGNNHVGLMRDGDSGDHLAAKTPSFPLYGAKVWGWVKYTANSHEIKIWANNAATRPAHALITKKVNLGQVFRKEPARTGFTAATGGSTVNADVISWHLKQK